jgi:hypothetical protein
VNTHAEVADIIEENDSRVVRRILRFTKQCANNDVRAAGFIDYGGAEEVVFFAEIAEFFGDGISSETRSAGNDNASWFSPGVGVDDLDSGKPRGGWWCRLDGGARGRLQR